MDVAAIIAAFVAAVAAVAAALITAHNTRIVNDLNRRFERERESTDFIAAKLEKLYLPISSSLKVTKILFDRYFEVNDESEKTSIEHAWRDHNSTVKEHLISGSMYLDPDAPMAVIDELLQHIVQWETVYKLKYEYHVYDGPVFAGIQEFGFRGFPPHVDDYFHRRVEELRNELHNRVAVSSSTGNVSTDESTLLNTEESIQSAGKDPLLEQAKQLIKEQRGYISGNFLQKRLHISSSRAADIMEQLFEEGFDWKKY